MFTLTSWHVYIYHFVHTTYYELSVLGAFAMYVMLLALVMPVASATMDVKQRVAAEEQLPSVCCYSSTAVLTRVLQCSSNRSSAVCFAKWCCFVGFPLRCPCSIYLCT